LTSARRVERRLRQVGAQLRDLREELQIVDEQLLHLRDEAGDKEIRAMVAETPSAAFEHRDAEAHAEAMAGHRRHIAQRIAELEARQDELLDSLSAARR
jgi:hypothetical protein